MTSLRNLAQEFVDADDAVAAGSNPADPSELARIEWTDRLHERRLRALERLRDALVLNGDGN